RLSDEIFRAFGSLREFHEKFSEAAAGLFGSGWAWLALGPDGKLWIEARSNADNPLRDGAKPILTCDVWEHAYYLDYQNDRLAYVRAFWERVNWDFAGRQLGGP